MNKLHVPVKVKYTNRFALSHSGRYRERGLKLAAVKNVEDKQNALEKILSVVTSVDSAKIETYVETLRSQNPGISNDDLAKKILNRKSFKNGLVGGLPDWEGLLLYLLPSQLI